MSTVNLFCSLATNAIYHVSDYFFFAFALSLLPPSPSCECVCTLVRASAISRSHIRPTKYLRDNKKNFSVKFRTINFRKQKKKEKRIQQHCFVSVHNVDYILFPSFIYLFFFYSIVTLDSFSSFSLCVDLLSADVPFGFWARFD